MIMQLYGSQVLVPGIPVGAVHALQHVLQQCVVSQTPLHNHTAVSQSAANELTRGERSVARSKPGAEATMPAVNLDTTVAGPAPGQHETPSTCCGL